LYDRRVNIRSWNWRLWSGLLLSAVAFISYFTLFVRWPATRDFPWVNLILFAIALVLLFAGVRRASRKVVPILVSVAGAAICVFFLVTVFVGMKRFPASAGAPRVGARAPDFTLLDINRRPVSLSQLLASSPRGVLLIFYRGYW
jgi:hypothetical protein